MTRPLGAAALAAMTLALASDESGGARETATAKEELVPLPQLVPGVITLDDALRRRRSVRDFSQKALSYAEIGQLCWAAQGITEADAGLRTAPSAGALYPLELYAVLPSGLFRYRPREHQLQRLDRADRRALLARGALGQDAVRRAGAALVLTTVTSRTSAKYGERAERYVQLEAGHAAQNVLLEAIALGLGAVPIGAFDDGDVRRALGASAAELPLYILAIGHLTR